MSAIALVKRGGVLVPVDQRGADLLARLRPGEGVAARQVLNVRHHRKLMALLRFAFDQWEGPQAIHEGERIEKNFTRFRNDLTILAGHYERECDAAGNWRLVARSLNFETLDDQEEFAELYDAFVTVIMRRVLTTYRREDLDEVVEKILRNFA